MGTDQLRELVVDGRDVIHSLVVTTLL